MHSAYSDDRYQWEGLVLALLIRWAWLTEYPRYAQTEAMDNADLEKLKVSPGRLLPKFKASVTDYSVTVSSEVKEVKLSPLTSDGGASYVIKVLIICQPACFGCIIWVYGTVS